MNELLSHLASGPWAMERHTLTDFLAAVSRIDASLWRPESSRPADAFAKEGDTAKIAIKGPILRSAIPMLRHFGLEHTGADEVRNQLAAAALDPSIKAVELDIDSPGGVASAGKDIAEDVFAVRSLGKRITAKTSGTAASAAYWIASQTDQITAAPAAIVGAIGVYTSIVDASEAAAAAGVTVHVVSSHELKGAGVMGAPVTANQIADLQRNIDTMARMFSADIERGRGGKIQDIAKLATGQVWVGGEARLNGLVDSIIPSPISKQSQQVSTAPQRASQENTMSNEQLAELEQLRADNAKLKAKADADAALERGRAIAAVKTKYADRFGPAETPTIDALAAKLDPAELEAYLAGKPSITRPSPTPVASSQAGGGSTFSEVEQASAARLGSTPERLAFFKTVESRLPDGSAKMRDGRVLSRAAFEKLIPALALVLALFSGSVAHATALGAGKAIKCKGQGNTKAYVMADSTTIYSGGMVMVNSSGLAAAAAASASNHGVVGVATETKTSAATGSCVNGTCTIPVQEAWCLMVGTTLGQEDVGNLVYAEDDQTVDDAAGANEPVAGMLVQYVGASSGWVHVSSIYTVRDAVADPLTLTGDFTGGGGAGAVTLTDSASSIVIPDNDTTALDIGSTGATTAMRFSTADNTENIVFNVGVGNAAGAITGAITLDASDCGKPQFVTAGIDTLSITLPALSAVPAGCILRFFYNGADGGALLDISPNAADGIEGSCTLAASVVELSGTDDADIGLTKATIKKGDTISLISGDADDWYAFAIQGICANN